MPKDCNSRRYNQGVMPRASITERTRLRQEHKGTPRASCRRFPAESHAQHTGRFDFTGFPEGEVSSLLPSRSSCLDTAPVSPCPMPLDTTHIACNRAGLMEQCVHVKSTPPILHVKMDTLAVEDVSTARHTSALNTGWSTTLDSMGLPPKHTAFGLRTSGAMPLGYLPSQIRLLCNRKACFLLRPTRDAANAGGSQRRDRTGNRCTVRCIAICASGQ